MPPVRDDDDHLGRKLGRRITTSLGGLLDSALLRAMQMRPPSTQRPETAPPPDRRAQLEAAAAFYNHPDTEAKFYAPPPPVRMSERPVRKLPDGEVVDLAFPTAWEPLWPGARVDYEEFRHNRTVHARLLRHHRPATSVAVCVHGYRGGSFFVEERAFSARYFYEQGMDVALFTLPFHGLRAGDGPIRWPGANIGRMNEGFGQAISDLRALVAWLRQRHPARVLLMGMSLGGYTTALYSTVEPVEFAAPIIPVGSMADLAWEWARGSQTRSRAERDGVTLDLLREAMKIHSPLARRPRVPPERMLVIAAHGDRIAPPEHGAKLAEHFGCDEIRFPGGHILQVGRAAAFEELLHRVVGAGRM